MQQSHQLPVLCKSTNKPDTLTRICFKIHQTGATITCTWNNITYSSDLTNKLVVDRITQFHPAVERLFLVVLHQLQQALKGRIANDEQAPLVLNATVFDLALSPGDKDNYVFRPGDKDNQVSPQSGWYRKPHKKILLLDFFY